MNDLEITARIKQLSRPHPSGGLVIERAAILASGAESPQIIDWIMAHAGTAETPVARGRGIHGIHLNGGTNPGTARPTRFVLPANSLN